MLPLQRHLFERPYAIAAPRRILVTEATRDVSYYEDDTASGLPVVLVHDLEPGAGALDVGALFDAIRRERAVVALDLPGFGYSMKPKAPWEREPYVRALEEILADVSRRYGATVDVVAVGLGAEIAARAVQRTTRVVRSLSIVAPTGFGRMAALARSMGHGAHAFAARVLGALGATSTAIADPWITGEVYDDLASPVLFAHGEGAADAAARVDAIVARHPRYTRQPIPGAGAIAHRTHPVETAAVLSAFWRSLAVRPQLRLIPGGRRGGAPKGQGPKAPRRGGHGSNSRRWRAHEVKRWT
ncbi:MAG: alpha/beta fold hydrolase [Labilithrix sp.]|nr:alpha/beta fold hydrolase [Labilithrix sp.]